MSKDSSSPSNQRPASSRGGRKAGKKNRSASVRLSRALDRALLRVLKFGRPRVDPTTRQTVVDAKGQEVRDLPNAKDFDAVTKRLAQLVDPTFAELADDGSSDALIRAAEQRFLLGPPGTDGRTVSEKTLRISTNG